MATVIAELLVKMGVDIGDAEKAQAKLAKGVDKTGKSVDSTKGKFKAFAGGLKQAGKALAGITAAAAAAGVALFKMVDQVTKSNDEIIKTATSLGTTTDALQRLTFSADRSGVSSANLVKGIRNLNKGLLEAGQGGGKLFRDALKGVGLELSDLEGLDTEKQMGVLADALSGVANEGERAALAGQLLGQRAGPALKVLLDEGSAGIKALGDEAESLNGVIENDLLKQSAQFQDTLLDVQTLFKGLLTEGIGAVLPVFQELGTEFKEFVKNNKPLLKQRLKEFFTDIVKAGKQLLPMVVSLVQNVAKFTVAINDALGPTNSMALAVVALGASFGGINGAAFAAGLAIGAWAAKTIASMNGVLDVIDDINLAAADAREQVARAELEAVEGKLDESIARDDAENAKIARQQAALGIKLRRGDVGTTLEATGPLNKEQADAAFKRAENLKQTAGNAAAKRAFDRAVAEGKSRGEAFAAGSRASRSVRANVDRNLGEAGAAARAAREAGATAEERRTAFDSTLLKNVEPEEDKAARRRGGGGGGRRSGAPAAAVAPTGPTSSLSLSEFLAKGSRGELGLAAASTPSTKDIEPSVAIDITNHNYNIDEMIIKVEGGSSPQATARSVKVAFQEETVNRLRRTAQGIAGNVAR